jgi:hypothetical protein
MAGVFHVLHADLDAVVDGIVVVLLITIALAAGVERRHKRDLARHSTRVDLDLK